MHNSPEILCFYSSFLPLKGGGGSYFSQGIGRLVLELCTENSEYLINSILFEVGFFNE